MTSSTGKRLAAIKKERLIFRHLDDLFHSSTEIEVEQGSRWVIFSDLHAGDGSKKDDFRSNAGLFLSVLKRHYVRDQYKLILNGDVEELQRFPESRIIGAWPELYWLLDQLHQQNRLIKLIGNHDMGLLLNQGALSRYPLHHGIRLNWKGNQLFVFHGHQASDKYLKYNRLLGISLKYLANPLRIRNFSVAHNSRKQYAIERKVYHFSVSRKIASVIGHTHRPLFESLSKADRLKYTIEEMCRRFVESTNEKEQKKIRKSIKNYRKELLKMFKKDPEAFHRRNIYNTIFTVPCLFNSGCVIGKRGITALELENGMIRLVHWFDKNTSKRYLKNYGYDPEAMDESDYYRMIINEEKLDYIFARIQLLS